MKIVMEKIQKYWVKISKPLPAHVQMHLCQPVAVQVDW